MNTNKYFRVLDFTSIDNKRISWDLSYMCEKNTRKIYVFEYDTILSTVPNNFTIPVIKKDGNNQIESMNSVTYGTLTNNITDKVVEKFGSNIASIGEKDGIIYINEQIPE